MRANAFKHSKYFIARPGSHVTCDACDTCTHIRVVGGGQRCHSYLILGQRTKIQVRARKANFVKLLIIFVIAHNIILTVNCKWKCHVQFIVASATITPLQASR